MRDYEYTPSPPPPDSSRRVTTHASMAALSVTVVTSTPSRSICWSRARASSHMWALPQALIAALNAYPFGCTNDCRQFLSVMFISTRRLGRSQDMRPRLLGGNTISRCTLIDTSIESPTVRGNQGTCRSHTECTRGVGKNIFAYTSRSLRKSATPAPHEHGVSRG